MSQLFAQSPPDVLHPNIVSLKQFAVTIVPHPGSIVETVGKGGVIKIELDTKTMHIAIYRTSRKQILNLNVCFLWELWGEHDELTTIPTSIMVPRKQ